MSQPFVTHDVAGGQRSENLKPEFCRDGISATDLRGTAGREGYVGPGLESAVTTRRTTYCPNWSTLTWESFGRRSVLLEAEIGFQFSDLMDCFGVGNAGGFCLGIEIG